MAACAGSAWPGGANAVEPPRTGPQADQASVVKYETQMSGVEDGDLKKLLTESSTLEALKDKPPISVIGLSRRAETDADRLTQVLQSRGYYAGTVRIDIDPSRSPARVYIHVVLGPLYRVSEFAIAWTGCSADCPELPERGSLGVKTGDPAVARNVVQAEHMVLQRLHDSGHPFAVTANRNAVVDHAARTLRVTETINPGPIARYGPLVFQGHTRVKQSFIQRMVPWHNGDLYQQSQVEDFQRSLVGTGLFKTAVVEPARTTPLPDGTLPVKLTLTPAKEHTVGAGLDYSTSEGPGGRLFWEHHNLFGGAEDFRATLRGNRLTRALELTLSKPEFRRRDQTLNGNFTIEDANTDAYKERGIEAGASLQRPLWPSLKGPLGPIWHGSLGLTLTAARIEDKGHGDPTGMRPVFLVGLPTQLTQDSTDNLLDPTKGTRLALTVTPAGGAIEGQGLGFVRNEAVGSGYYTLGKRPAFTVAVRGRLGAIVGAQRATLPANQRFYSGGGGSVRGYKYQRVGPLDSRNDPLGGRSVVEFSTELRIRITDTIGIVPFVDGGQVYTTSYPKFDSNLLWAGGLGFRYYSPIGPLRVDVASPINPRPSDRRFQFYISLGQAF